MGNNHDHHHDHHHNHEHHHNTETSLTFEEKMIKLLKHWIKHNEDHAVTYREWAEKATTANMTEIPSLLDDAAKMNISINKKLEEALKIIDKF